MAQLCSVLVAGAQSKELGPILTVDGSFADVASGAWLAATYQRIAWVLNQAETTLEQYLIRSRICLHVEEFSSLRSMSLKTPLQVGRY